MKNFLAIAFVMTALLSCSQYEHYPVERITNDLIYDTLDRNGTNAELVVNGIYGFLPNGFNRIGNVVLDAATDDAIPSELNHGIETLSKSRLTAGSNNPDGYWGRGYEAIRRVNQFLDNIDVVPRDEQTKTYWKAEVRFIRAMNYFELLKRYGGVPLLGDQYFGLEDDIQVQRSTFDEIVAYIVAECDAVVPDLRTDPIEAVHLGRITKAGAMALKSRALLYAASPLNNPDNDARRWEQALEAARDIINLGVYNLAPSFSGHFTNRTSPEVILAYQSSQNQNMERQNSPVGYEQPNVSQGHVSPTQDLVDAFPMANGRAISEEGSGYDANNPYSDRDQRLAGTVFYNGMNWLGRPVQLFEGGLDNPGSAVQVARKTRTGYYMRRFLGAFENATDYSNQNHNFPIFRYTEILLNDAEAANELGDVNAAYDRLKALRQRAGIPAGADGMHGLTAGMGTDEMRDAIRLERRLELAFEEHRFWDLRRWKIAVEVLNKDVWGTTITRRDDGGFDYDYHPVDYVSFAEKHYLYPIPNNEIVRSNGGITQNPGW